MHRTAIERAVQAWRQYRGPRDTVLVVTHAPDEFRSQVGRNSKQAHVETFKTYRGVAAKLRKLQVVIVLLDKTPVGFKKHDPWTYEEGEHLRTLLRAAPTVMFFAEQ